MPAIRHVTQPPAGRFAPSGLPAAALTTNPECFTGHMDSMRIPYAFQIARFAVNLWHRPDSIAAPAGAALTAPVRTTCPYCGVGCGVLATPDGRGGAAIAGDPEHPSNFGRLCSKGAALGETLGLEDRLLAPRIRGRDAGWDEALDLIAATFRAAIDAHGPDSVAIYGSGQLLTEDYYVANKLMKGFIGSANIDTNSRLCMASSVAGHRRAFGADTVPGTYEDLEQADLVILVGSNLAWCHPVLYQRLAAAKEARPEMRVVVLDPRRTATCALADLHLPLRGDTDVALFTWLLAETAAHGALDAAWIAAHVDGLPAAVEAARPWDRDRTAAACGLDPADLDAFLRLWLRTDRTVTVFSQGVNQSASGTDKVNAILNCHLATGRIGRPGAGPFSVTGQPNAMGGREVGGLANMLAAHLELEDPAHRAAVRDFWRSPTIAARPGLKAVDMFRAAADGRIKALWILATNPAASMPEADAVAAALAACPFVVVSDVTARTDTARRADVLLPAAGWGEKSGTVTNSERRISRQRAFLPRAGRGAAGLVGAGAGRTAARLAGGLRLVRAGRDLPRACRTLRLRRRARPRLRHRRPRRPRRRRLRGDGPGAVAGRRTRPVLRRRRLLHAPAPCPHAPARRARTRRRRHAAPQHRPHPRPVAHDDPQRPGAAPQPAHRRAVRRAQPRRRRRPRHRPGRSRHRRRRATAASCSGRSSPTASRRAPSSLRCTGQARRPAPAASARSSPPPPTRTRASPRSRPERSSSPAMRPPGTASRSAAPGRCPTPPTGRARASPAAGGSSSPATPSRPTGKPGPVPPSTRRTPRSSPGPTRAAAGRRMALIEDGAAVAALYAAPEPVELARSHLAAAFGEADAAALLAGRPGAAMPDRGPIVCACFDVGVTAIAEAIASARATSVAEIGALLRAGTNCGSCRPELAALLARDAARLAAE